MRSLPLLLTCLFLAHALAAAAESDAPTLESLHELVAEAEADRDRTLRELDEATSPSRANWLRARVAEQDEQLAGLRRNLDLWISGEQDPMLSADSAEPRSLQQEIREILDPVLKEWREATSGPREIDALNFRLRQAREREAEAARALARIDALAAEAVDEGLIESLDVARRRWAARQREAAAQARIAAARIESLSKDAPTTLETLSGFARGFWKSRGVNVLAALAAFIAVLWLSWLAYRIFSERRKGRPGGGTRFLARLTAVLAAAGSTVIAFGAALLVFYLRGDWLLLTLSSLLLFGAVWGGRHALANYLDQVRLLLNIGPVREGERLVHNGLPWIVDRLGMVAEFHNPALAGGRLRIPLRMLHGMTSRPHADDEPWFPTALGDWLLFQDNSFGQVVHQSPEQVFVAQKGGSTRAWLTPDFLEESPVNLSRGFRVRINFGLDYRHASEITTSIPQLLAAALRERLADACGGKDPLTVTVELTDAADSSLELALRVNFSGTLAPRYRELHRLVQSIAVDTAVAHGWTIPFPQRTLHQA